MIIPKLILSLYVFTSCATGPSNEKKSSLNYLSGEHFRADQSINPFEISRQMKSTIIEGKVYFLQRDDDFHYPVKYQEVSLMKGGQKIAQTNTDNFGNYKFSENLNNGKYKLKIKSTKFNGIKELFVKKYTYKDIDIITQKK